MPNIDELYKKIYNCERCALSILDFNKARSKFGGTKDNTKFFWIGQNPGVSYNKKTGDEVFPIKGNNNKQQDEFTIFLFENNIYQVSYFTNVVKCSTPKNRVPNDTETVKCARYLYYELMNIKPRVVITLGKYSREILNKFNKIYNFDHKLYHVYHPTYVYSYNRKIISFYQDEIKRIRDENL